MEKKMCANKDKDFMQDSSLDDTEKTVEFSDRQFEAYLKQLDKFNLDYSQKMQSLLNLLTTAEEALTIEEISYLLTGNNNSTSQSFEILIDISNFLTIEKDAVRGNVFKITHPDLVNKIANNKKLQKNKKFLLKNLRRMLLDISKQDYAEQDFSQKEFDGTTWLIANIGLFNISYDNLHSLLVLMDNSHFEKFYQIKRKIKFFTYLVSVYKDDTSLYFDNLLAADFDNENFNIEKALANLTDAISFYYKVADKHSKDDSFLDFNNTASLLMNKAKALELLEPKIALACYNSAIAIYQELVNEYRSGGGCFDLDGLSISLRNKITILPLDTDKAVDDLQCVLSIYQQQEDEHRNDGI